MDDHKSTQPQKAQLPLEVVELMQTRLNTVIASIAAMEKAPEVKALLNVRRHLEEEATLMINALDKERRAQLRQSPISQQHMSMPNM